VQDKCRELETLQFKVDMLESKERESAANINALSAENIGLKAKLAVCSLSLFLYCVLPVIIVISCMLDLYSLTVFVEFWLGLLSCILNLYFFTALVICFLSASLQMATFNVC